MKKALSFVLQIILAAALSAGISIIALAILGIRDMGIFLWTYLCIAILIALLMGAFDYDERKSEKHTSIKDARNYGQAAVFIGTACLYMGTPQQCEDVCDDLWHRGVQAEYHELTGEETQFDVL